MTGPWGYGGAGRERFWSCKRPRPFGWYCRRGMHIDGPCALVPKWWNLRELLRRR